jgi:hypothetical protein
VSRAGDPFDTHLLRVLRTLLTERSVSRTAIRHFAEHYAKFLPLAIVPAPIAFPRMRFDQLWHDRTHRSAGHRWFRGLLTATGEKLWRRRGARR